MFSIGWAGSCGTRIKLGFSIKFASIYYYRPVQRCIIENNLEIALLSFRRPINETCVAFTI